VGFLYTAPVLRKRRKRGEENSSQALKRKEKPLEQAQRTPIEVTQAVVRLRNRCGQDVARAVGIFVKMKKKDARGNGLTRGEGQP